MRGKVGLHAPHIDVLRRSVEITYRFDPRRNAI